MADNTRMKEIVAELKKNADDIACVNETMQNQLMLQTEQMERMQRTNDSQFTQLNTVMAQVLQSLQNIPMVVRTQAWRIQRVRSR
jgi:hypothetical protein